VGPTIMQGPHVSDQKSGTAKSEDLVLSGASLPALDRDDGSVLAERN
jgi:hypothetical protein